MLKFLTSRPLVHSLRSWNNGFIYRSLSSSSSSKGSSDDSSAQPPATLPQEKPKKEIAKFGKPTVMPKAANASETKQPAALDPNASKDLKKKDDDDDDRYVIIGPDGIPYDPSKDPEWSNEYWEFKYPQFFTRHKGMKRIVKIMKSDIEIMKKGRIHMIREELPPPWQADVCVIGGGVIGSSVAYFIKKIVDCGYSVVVLDKDLTYSKASTTLSAGGIRQQWQHPENVMMSMFTADFLRNAKRDLAIVGGEPPDMGFTPQGYLTLATEAEAEQMIESHKMQIELGALVELYTADKIKEKFPYINTEGIVLGAMGVQNEGWFDPWSLLLALKAKAQMLGVEYYEGEVIDFNFKTRRNTLDPMTGDFLETANHVIYRMSDGSVKQLECHLIIVAAGAGSGDIATLLRYGTDDVRGVRKLKIPIERRKRYIYNFNCKDGPGLDFPFLINTTGDYVRREGLGGNFICGRSPPTPEEEPPVDNLDVDYNYFDTHIHPLIAHRVPAFEGLKVKSAWAGYYDYNSFDQHPLIGHDPFYVNILWACGFSGHGLQMGPAVGRAIAEYIIYNEYQTIDLRRYNFNRIVHNQPLKLDNIV